MLTIGPAPERLNPVFMTHPEFLTEGLFKSENATLEINGKKFKGVVEIKHYWESNVSQIEFRRMGKSGPEPFSEGDLSFTQAKITAPETRFPMAFSINSYGDNFARGAIYIPVCIGTCINLTA